MGNLRCLITFLCVASPSYAERFVFTPSADTALIEWLPANNVGSGTRLRTGGQYEGRSRALVRFDLGAIAPTSKVVYARANFRIFYPSSDEGRLVGGIKLFRELRAWSEGTGGGPLGAPTGDGASWKYADGPAESWLEPGGKYSSDWYYLDSGFAPAPASQQGDLASFATKGVRDDVQLWVTTPAANFGWLIYNPIETDIACCRTGADGQPENFRPFSAVEVASREDLENKPQLMIGTGNPEVPLIFINDEYFDAAELDIDAPSQLSLATLFPDGRIFYTLDGSKPTLASTRYGAPIVLSGGETIRAIAYNADYSAGGVERPAMNVRALAEFPLEYVTGTYGHLEFTDNDGPPTYSNSSSTGGTLSVASNHVVRVTAIPATGYSFAGWSGDFTNTEPTLTFAMKGPVSISANFILTPLNGPTLYVRNVSPDFIVLQFQAERTFTYRLESSLDLANWTVFQSYSNQVATVDTILSGSDTRAFYRLRSEKSNPVSPY